MNIEGEFESPFQRWISDKKDVSNSNSSYVLILIVSNVNLYQAGS